MCINNIRRAQKDNQSLMITKYPQPSKSTFAYYLDA